MGYDLAASHFTFFSPGGHTGAAFLANGFAAFSAFLAKGLATLGFGGSTWWVV